MHDDPQYDKNKEKIHEIVKKYSSQQWLESIHSQLGDAKKILLVSDFSDKIGGIETYIHDVKDILISAGYEVKIVGATNR
jgi:hypothetical protein